MRVSIGWLAAGAQVMLVCCGALAQATSHSGTVPLNSIVEGLERAQASVRPQVSYQVIREYRLSGNDSSANSDVVAEVDFRPPASKHYRIEKTSGSSRGPQVVQRVLDHEVEATSSDNQARTAINRNNYDFSYAGEAVLDGRACYLLGLTPKRKDKDLIAGQIWVDQHSYFVRQIEGELTKTPSWWLKKVHVRLTFAEVEGTWLESGMEAVADVRIVGRHTLTSKILDYRAANQVAETVKRHRALY